MYFEKNKRLDTKSIVDEIEKASRSENPYASLIYSFSTPNSVLLYKYKSRDELSITACFLFNFFSQLLSHKNIGFITIFRDFKISFGKRHLVLFKKNYNG